MAIHKNSAAEIKQAIRLNIPPAGTNRKKKRAGTRNARNAANMNTIGVAGLA